MRVVKIILYILLTIILLIAAGVAYFFYTFDPNDYRDMIVRQVSTSLGCPLTLGNLEMKLSFVPTIKITEMTIATPDSIGPEKATLKLENAEATIEIMPLWKKQVRISNVSVGKAELNLIQPQKVDDGTAAPTQDSPSATGGEELTVKAKATAEPTPTPEYTFHNDEISIKNMIVTFYKNDKQQQITLSNFSLKNFSVIRFNLAYNNHNYIISANTSGLFHLIKQQPNFAISLDVSEADWNANINTKIEDLQKLQNIVISIRGTARNPMRIAKSYGLTIQQLPAELVSFNAHFEGDLNNVEIKKLTAEIKNKMTFSATGKVQNLIIDPTLNLDAQVDITDDALAARFGIKPIQATTSIQANNHRIYIPQLSVIADRSDLVANADITLGDKPTIQANLSSKYLSIDDLKAAQKTSSTPSPKTPARGATPKKNEINLSFLKKIEGRVNVAVDYLKLTDALNAHLNLRTTANLQNGILKLSPLTIQTLNGSISGIITANTTNNQFSSDLTGKNLDVSIIKQIGNQIQNASMDFDLNVKTQGKTPKELLARLNGNAQVDMSNGVIVNKWFNTLPSAVGLLKKHTNTMAYSTEDQKNNLMCGTANIQIKNGILTSQDQIAIETSTINFVVSGHIDLNKETLNLSLLPSLNETSQKTNDVLALTNVLKITGPFKDLSAHMDARAITEAAVTEGMKKLLKIESDAPSSPPTYSLCQQALGKTPKAYTIAVQKKTHASPAVTTTPSAKSTPQPKEFKKQLLDSLTKALTTPTN